MADECSPSPEAEVAYSQVRLLVGRLPTHQREVLRERYWEGRTLQEIGAKRGRTRERARQLTEAALDQLRLALEA